MRLAPALSKQALLGQRFAVSGGDICHAAQRLPAAVVVLRMVVWVQAVGSRHFRVEPDGSESVTGGIVSETRLQPNRS